MDEKVFGRELINLGFKMSKQVSPELIGSLYGDLKFIPSGAWHEICQSAVEQWESWPRNSVKAFKHLWFEWNKGRKKAEIDFQQCHICDETGVLDVEYYSQSYRKMDVGIVLCGHCNNWQRHFGNRKPDGLMTLRLEDMEAKGFEWVGK